MEESDVEVYGKIISKDANSLEILYDRYESLLYNFIYKITQDKQSSEEVLQDVFMKIWNQKARFDSSKGKMSTWLITISRNLAIDYIRKRKMSAYEYDEERDNLTADNVPESELITKEQSEQIKEYIDELDGRQQIILYLFYFKGCNHKEISQKLEIPLGTVKSRLRLSIQHLKHKFKNNKKGEMN